MKMLDNLNWKLVDCSRTFLSFELQSAVMSKDFSHLNVTATTMKHYLSVGVAHLRKKYFSSLVVLCIWSFMLSLCCLSMHLFISVDALRYWISEFTTLKNGNWMGRETRVGGRFSCNYWCVCKKVLRKYSIRLKF